MSFEGAIGEIDLVQRLVELGREQFTGAIRFEQDGIIKIVYFKGGDVLGASTNDRKDAVDEILLRAGKVGREHIKQALAKRKETETLGDALLNLGFITRKELTWARRVQVIGILRSVRSWTNGTYAIVPDYLPKREEGTLFPFAQIIVEFIVTEQDRQSFDRAMDGGEAVLRKTDEFDRTYDKLGLNEDAQAIVSQIDGVKSAADIASATGAEAFNVYKLLEALRMLGLIEKSIAKPQVTDELDFASAGVADAADSWSASAEPAQNSFDSPASFDAPATDFSAPADFGQPSDFGATPNQFDTPSDFSPQLDDSPAFATSEPEPTSSLPSMPEDLPMPPMQPVEEPPAPRKRGMPTWQFEEERKIPFALKLDPNSTAPADEPDWGFDQSQIEAAQRATAGTSSSPMGSPAPRVAPGALPLSERKRVNLPQARPKPVKRGINTTLGLALSLLLAGLIAGGWFWWRGRNTPAPVADATPARPRPVVATPPTTSTAPEMVDATSMDAASAAQAASATIATTATVAPPPTPAPATTTTAAAAAAPPMTPAKTTTAPSSRLETTKVGRVITNTPAASDSNRERFDAMARENAKNASGNYTVQFELVCQTSSVQKAMAAGGASVWFVPTTYRNQSCYRVFWGRYDTREQAMAAVEKIPAALRGSSPVVVSVPKS